jgi:hypothetical protein
MKFLSSAHGPRLFPVFAGTGAGVTVVSFNHHNNLVTPGLDPGVQGEGPNYWRLLLRQEESFLTPLRGFWIAGSSPAMTTEGTSAPLLRRFP